MSMLELLQRRQLARLRPWRSRRPWRWSWTWSRTRSKLKPSFEPESTLQDTDYRKNCPVLGNKKNILFTSIRILHKKVKNVVFRWRTMICSLSASIRITVVSRVGRNSALSSTTRTRLKWNSDALSRALQPGVARLKCCIDAIFSRSLAMAIVPICPRPK